MKTFLALHDFMKQRFPHTVRDEVQCTCGAANHVKLLFFRVNGRLSTVVLPESKDLSPDRLAHSLGGAHVEVLSEHEVDAILSAKPGKSGLHKNAQGTPMYLDQRLLTCAELVFCPRMFFEQEGQCFRIPTREFSELSCAMAIPLSGTPDQERDVWET